MRRVGLTHRSVTRWLFVNFYHLSGELRAAAATPAVLTLLGPSDKYLGRMALGQLVWAIS
jgi:hypothetical protein